MSETKLVNYLNKSIFEPPSGPCHHTPVILSDSKGNRLRDSIIHPFDNNIVWWCKGGSPIENSLAWLKRNLDAKLLTLGPIRLYIWLGTCNLTTKPKGKKPYITLTTTKEHSVEHIISTLHEFKVYLASHHQVDLTFLEIPIYSITTWNRFKKHPDPSLFKEQDRDLQQQVAKVNEEIRKLNSELNTISPDFSKFLKASSRHRTRSKRETKHYYNFNLYRDGVHPGQNLARVWLREIGDRIKRECW